jgi:hypothetical protein
MSVVAFFNTEQQSSEGAADGMAGGANAVPGYVAEERGSKACCRPSPMMFTAMTVTKINIPG